MFIWLGSYELAVGELFHQLEKNGKFSEGEAMVIFEQLMQGRLCSFGRAMAIVFSLQGCCSYRLETGEHSFSYKSLFFINLYIS